MKLLLASAAMIALVAGAAQAQLVRPPSPYAPSGGFKPYAPPKPYEPPKPASVYADGPFSPAAEARRARKAAEPPAGGLFSPDGEAKRARAAARRDAANNPFRP